MQCKKLAVRMIAASGLVLMLGTGMITGANTPKTVHADETTPTPTPTQAGNGQPGGGGGGGGYRTTGQPGGVGGGGGY